MLAKSNACRYNLLERCIMHGYFMINLGKLFCDSLLLRFHKIQRDSVVIPGEVLRPRALRPAGRMDQAGLSGNSGGDGGNDPADRAGRGMHGMKKRSPRDTGDAPKSAFFIVFIPEKHLVIF